MPKIVGTRERVHQPFYDSLIRTDGHTDLRANPGQNQISSRMQLFLRSGSDLAVSNLTTGGTFPSDQTFITLAVRVWTYFRFNPEAVYSIVGATQSVGSVPGVAMDRVMRVHKLYHQTQNQIFWQFQAGDKPQLTTFTSYTPMAGGLDGFFGGFGTGTAGSGGSGGGSDPFLGSAADFAVLAGTPDISSTGATIISGNVGIAPAAAIIGFPPGVITGTQHAADAVALQAKSDLTAAYLAITGLGGVAIVPADLGGLTFSPGVYTRGATGLTGVVTLDAGGNPNATFIFNLGAITAAVGSSVVLVNGARAHNVYFTTTSSAALNTTVSWQGNILALTSITLATGATIVGRVLARNGTVTFQANLVSLDPFDPSNPAIAALGPQPAGGTNGNSLPRANNGIPTSSALMRLARPILIPPRQGFQCIATLAQMGQTVGANIQEQLLGQLDGSIGPLAAITTGQTSLSTGNVTVNGTDDVEKDCKYIVDGLHSRDVL